MVLNKKAATNIFTGKHSLASLLCFSLLIIANACKPVTEEVISEVYFNGRIYTMDSDLPQASAIAIRDGKILNIGSDSDMEEYRCGNTRWTDLGGRTVLPGLIETHIHPMSAKCLYAADPIYLEDSWNKEEIIGHIKDYYRENPDIQHIVAIGFVRNNILDENNELPHKYELDAVSTDIPIVLFDDGIHSSWCNSKALEIAGVDKNTPDISDQSRFIRMEGSDEPSGYNTEEASIYVFLRMPFQTSENLYYGAQNIFSELNSMGFTGVFDAGEAGFKLLTQQNPDLLIV